MQNPLFVTSFVPEMYRHTGLRLIRSFFQMRVPGTLLIACERGAAQDINANQWLIRYDLEHSQFLKDWLERNRDIIPASLGGTLLSCDCSGVESHQAGCPWDWFNRNASRWFRKIVALDFAWKLQGFDAVIWIDSDCEFSESMTLYQIESWFGGGSAFFLKGPDRSVIESGVIGFRHDAGGTTLLESTIEHYRTGRFRQESRWDDAYQFQLSMERHPHIPVNDCACRANGTNHNHVVELSQLGQFVKHAKGYHRVAGLMG